MSADILTHQEAEKSNIEWDALLRPKVFCCVEITSNYSGDALYPCAGYLCVKHEELGALDRASVRILADIREGVMVMMVVMTLCLVPQLQQIARKTNNIRSFL